jgi:xanthine/uracil permease
MIGPSQFAAPFTTGGSVLLMALLICGSPTPLQAQDHQASKIASEGKVVTTQGWLWGLFGGGGVRAAPLLERERQTPREMPATLGGLFACGFVMVFFGRLASRQHLRM